jgi:hypothetical protein
MVFSRNLSINKDAIEGERKKREEGKIRNMKLKERKKLKPALLSSFLNFYYTATQRS